MSRLENKKKFGFVQLGAIEESEYDKNDWEAKFQAHKSNSHTLEVASMIASYVEAPNGGRFMTPCSGYGVAENEMCNTWGIPNSQRWFAELHDTRGKYAKEFADHVAICDSLHYLKIDRGQFQVGYFNPPFDTESAEMGGQRYEYQFFARFIEARSTIVPNGIVIIVAPQDVLALEKNVNHLARAYDQLTVVRLPDELRKYREAVVIGVVRETFRRHAEMYARAKEISKRLHGELPVLSFQEKPLYTVPTPKRIKSVLWFPMTDATPENALIDVKETGGAWASDGYRKRQRKARETQKLVRPLFPPSRPGAILGVASGKINNRKIKIGGRDVTIKGTTQVFEKILSETESTGSSTKVITRSIKQRVPFIVTLDEETGAAGLYKGDEGIQKLAAITGAVDAMVDAYKESCPPIYDMNIPADIQEIVDRMIPLSGYALPGQKPGFIPMQKHIIAALVQGFREKDPNTNSVWNQLFLSAEMGAGKSKCGIGIAECLRILAPTNEGRAFTVILSGPATVIGSRDSVYQHDLYHADPVQFKAEYPRGKKPKPLSKISQWTAEWRDMLPDWYTEILETPSQVSKFFRDAQTDPTPRVGLISISWLSLSAGREVGVNYHKPFYGLPVSPDLPEAEQFRRSKMLGRRADMLAEEQNELKKWLEKGKKKKKIQGSVDDEVDTQYEARPGVTPRTIKRDRMFRCGHAGRRLTPLPQGEGIFCPTCGRRLLKSDGTLYEEDKFYKEGSKGHNRGICRYCGDKLHSMTRKYDSVSDRNVPLFESKEWNDWYLADIPYVVRGEEKKEKVQVVLYEGWTYVDGKRVATPYPIPQMENGRPRTAIIEVSRSQSTLEYRQGRVIPWGKRPTSNPRLPLAEFIERARFPVDIYLCDEIHKHKGRTTDNGAMLRAMVRSSERTLGLTGTIYDGKATGVFSMLQSLNNTYLKENYNWSDISTFAEEMGIVEEISVETTKDSGDARANSGRVDTKTQTYKKERNGITADLAQIIWAQAVIILLKQMGFKLPKYEERLAPLQLPEDVQIQYNKLYQFGKDLVKPSPGEKSGKDVLSSWLQSCLTFGYAPWNETICARSKWREKEFWPAFKDGKKEIFDPVTNKFLPGIKLFNEDMILPHHEALAESVIEDYKVGRRSIIFVQHTNKIDLQVNVKKKLEMLAEKQGIQLKVAILRGTKVKGADRIGWFADQVEAGINVVICHPQLVDTGVNLIDFNRLTFMEPSYSLAVAMQAKKRHYRPTQTGDCWVDWMLYQDTMVEQAIDIISTKMLAATLLSGDDVSQGIYSGTDDGMSLLQALARQVLHGEDIPKEKSNIAERIAELGRVTQNAMNSSDLLIEIVPDEQITVEEVYAIAEAIIESTPVPVQKKTEDLAADLASQTLAAMTRWVPFDRINKAGKKGVKKTETKVEVTQAMMEL